MTSRATIRRRTGRTTQDETNGREVPEWEVRHTSVPTRMSPGGQVAGKSRGVSVGGVEFEEASAQVHFPHWLVDLRDGDFIEVTSGEWPGTVWRVREALKGDQSTARRVPVNEVDRPEEW